MSFPVTLNGRTYTIADFEGTNYVDGFPDALEDFVTQAGDIYNSTSTSSVTIGTGEKTFTTADSDKPYQAGTPLRIADAAAPETNFLDCIVTSYSGTTLVVDVFGFAGSGTISDWTINIGGAKTVDGTLPIAQGGTGATTASAAADNLGLGTGDDVEFSSLTVGGFTSTGIDDNASSNALTLDSSGNVAIAAGNGDGFGITFNSTSHNASTTLDWYEEGTWTPVLSDAATGGNVATGGTQRASFVRIGNVVHCSFELDGVSTSGMTSGNEVYIQGLPFVASGNIVQRAAVALYAGVTRTSLLLETISADNYLNLRGSGGTSLKVSDLSSSISLGSNFSYIV